MIFCSRWTFCLRSTWHQETCQRPSAACGIWRSLTSTTSWSTRYEAFDFTLLLLSVTCMYRNKRRWQKCSSHSDNIIQVSNLEGKSFQPFLSWCLRKKTVEQNWQIICPEKFIRFTAKHSLFLAGTSLICTCLSPSQSIQNKKEHCITWKCPSPIQMFLIGIYWLLGRFLSINLWCLTAHPYLTHFLGVSSF